MWDTTALNWTADAGASYTMWNNATPDSATFANTAGTVTLGEAITASSISLNSNGYTIDLSGFDLTVTGSTGGGAPAISTTTITNTSGTTKTFTTAGFGSNSGPLLSGNMNVTFTGVNWTPAINHTFTGTLELLGTGTVRSDNNGTGLGSNVGLVRVGNATTFLLNTSSGQFRTFTRDIEYVGTGASTQVSGVKAATVTGNLSGAGTLRMIGSQGMLVLAGENSAFTGLISGSSAGWFVVAKSDTAFGVTGDPTKNISITGASGIGFMGDSDGSINVGAKNLSISGSAHGDGLGNVHNFSGNNSYAGNIAMSNIINFGADGGSSLLLSGIVSGSRPFQKVGAGTIILGAANTYGNTSAGPTDVRQGTLRLDFSQATAPLVDIINNGNASNTSASNLVLSGGTLEVQGKGGATNSQRFRNSATVGFTINAGASAVRAIQNGATSLSVNFGQLPTRNIGGTVDFTLPTAGSFDTSTGTADTILTNLGVAFATVDGIGWAAKNSANTSIVAGSSIAGFYTANDATSLSGNADMSADAVTTLGSSPTLTSLRFNTAGARTIDATGQTLSTGGILVISNVGNSNSTITGGTLRGATDRDLVVIQNNTANKLTIGSTLDNSGTASGLTKTGAGTLELTAGNTYSGATTVTGGVSKLSHANALPGGVATAGGTSNLIFKGGVIGLTSDSGNFTRGLGTAGNQVQFTGSGGFAAYGGDRIVNLGGAGVGITWNSTSATNNALNFIRSNFSLILGASDADGMVDYQNNIGLGSTSIIMSRTIQVENGSAPVDGKLSGVISGEGGLIKAGPGTLELSNAANTYIGPTTVSQGTLLVSGSIVGVSGTAGPVNLTGGTLLLGASNRISNSSPINLAGGTFNTGGFSETVGALTLSDSSTIDLGSGASILTFGAGTTFASSEVLTINNWSGSLAGNGTDQLIFSQDMSSSLSQFSFTGFGGATQIDRGAGQFEIVPVPEPSAIFGALALLGLVGYRERRRLRGIIARRP